MAVVRNDTPEGARIEMEEMPQPNLGCNNIGYLDFGEAEEAGIQLDADENEGDLDANNEENFDPWALPEFKDVGPNWSDLDQRGKAKRVATVFGKIVLLFVLLYFFICSLDFLSSAFRLLGGKAAGEAFASNKILSNPVAGLMIGILATVLVQSSSTTTSIVVSMVASDILPVKPAIPIVMGANVGTTVTNTIVSLAQLTERNEFRRAFAGAVVHDIFNWLSVLVLLPLEVITGYLRRLTGLIIRDLHLSEGKKTNQKLLKVVTEPLTKLIIQIDKKVITKIALGKTDGKDKSLIKNCKTEEISVSRVGEETNQTRNVTIITEKDTCSFLFEGTTMSDTAVGVILLVVAIFMLLGCLIFIVKILHSLLRSKLAKIIKKTINADFPGPFKFLTGYLAILVGAGMTMLLQSSSIFTSAITPLIGVGVMTLERAFPLTLGANIGTTATGILAALASSSNLDKALQIAFCHLFFNISGIILWYPIPHMRRVPIRFAKSMGNKSAEYRWFAVSYLILLFFIFPATVFGLSLAGWRVLLGVCLPFLLFLLFVIVVNILQRKAPHILPERLQDWEWLPEWLRSLEPFDCLLIKTKTKIKNCWEAVVLYFHR
ncbi:sodium-dependent phosphate transport protein 2B-like isoform X1 [Acropora millepora]|uniref:sodium-dependent phosphate transport protein 2B-like isoform X1 n=1 Tax=Acropora millepora TaxID=45264 RepID=UPI001CF1FECB|nr:sodium-dependent phosphate transport protein 2B-like isoform X1 [Acropora millepora]